MAGCRSCRLVLALAALTGAAAAGAPVAAQTGGGARVVQVAAGRAMVVWPAARGPLAPPRAGVARVGVPRPIQWAEMKTYLGAAQVSAPGEPGAMFSLSPQTPYLEGKGYLVASNVESFPSVPRYWHYAADSKPMTVTVVIPAGPRPQMYLVSYHVNSGQSGATWQLTNRFGGGMTTVPATGSFQDLIVVIPVPGASTSSDLWLVELTLQSQADWGVFGVDVTPM